MSSEPIPEAGPIARNVRCRETLWVD